MGSGFPIALEGVAYTKFFAADWAGGRQALAEARKAAQRPNERVDVDLVCCRCDACRRADCRGPEAARCDGRLPDATPTDVAFMPVYRGMALIETARYRDASAEATKAIERAKAGGLPPFATNKSGALGVDDSRAAAGLTGDAAAAQKDVEACRARRRASRQSSAAVGRAFRARDGGCGEEGSQGRADAFRSVLEQRWILPLAGDGRQPEGERSRGRRRVARPPDADLRARPDLSFLRSVANRTPGKQSN